MTDVRPFRGLRYDFGRASLSRVLVPPYDVIAPEERADWYARDPHNAIRLELLPDAAADADADYTVVRDTLAAWQREGVLVRESEPAFYALRQGFTAPDGTKLVREGFFAALRLEDYEAGIVRPHERTLAGPKADRLKLLRASEANLSVVFLLYEDHEARVARALASAFDDDVLATGEGPGGVDTTLARVSSPEAIAAVRAVLGERPVVIADGHHRYETARAYRDERRAAAGAAAEAPYDFTLAYFANAHAEGSLLLPIHRLICKGSAPSAAAWRERLPAWQCQEIPLAGPDAVPGLLAEHLSPLADRPSFAADDGSGTLRLFSRAADGDELPIQIIHREVVDGVFGLDADAVRDGAVAYAKDPVRAARDVRAGRGCVALYLNALTPDDVFRVTGAGEVLPQKSTFFTPKLPSGLCFRLLDEVPEAP